MNEVDYWRSKYYEAQDKILELEMKFALQQRVSPASFEPKPTECVKKGGGMPEFLTIREVAKKAGFPEGAIRKMVSRGECPGRYNGNRFYVNFAEFTQKMCDDSMKGG